MDRKTLRLGLGLALLVGVVVASTLAAVAGARTAAPAKATAAGFTNFELAGTPPNPPATVCPGSAR